MVRCWARPSKFNDQGPLYSLTPLSSTCYLDPFPFPTFNPSNFPQAALHNPPVLLPCTPRWAPYPWAGTPPRSARWAEICPPTPGLGCPLVPRAELPWEKPLGTCSPDWGIGVPLPALGSLVLTWALCLWWLALNYTTQQVIREEASE